MNLNHGVLENLIMNVIWDSKTVTEEYLTVSQVQKKLNGLNTRKKWAYTTVKTILDRLTEKGLLHRIKEGKKFTYITLMSRNEMAEKALKKVALEYFRNDFDKMSKFVNELNYQNEKTLVHVYR